MLFTHICSRNFYNKHNFLKCCFALIIYVHQLYVRKKLNLSIDYSDNERGRRRRLWGAQRRSFYMHNRQQRIKSLRMVVQTSGKNQYSYIYILKIFLYIYRKLKYVAQLLNATHLVVLKTMILN